MLVTIIMGTSVESLVAEPEVRTEPKTESVGWDRGRTQYTVEIQAGYMDFERFYKKSITLFHDVWMVSEEDKKVGKVLIGRASKFRTSELTDGRTSIVVCDVTFDKAVWEESWKKKGALRLWMDREKRQLRVMDFNLIGPVEEMYPAKDQDADPSKDIK